jgi:acyl-CoA dehydrogenase
MQTTLTPTPQQSELQERARGFVEVLMPLEVEAERACGRLPPDTVEMIRREALERRLGGGLHAVEHGGQGWSHVEWFLVEEQLPTLFLVDRGTPGIEVVDDPPFTHSYPHGHPTLRFAGVEVGDDAIVGGIGGGDELQRGWFAEERLGIAARGVGAMWRLIEEATAWALEREQGGRRIMDYQGVSFPLADSAAGRLLGLEVARLADAEADPKVVHAKASMAKLFVSEAVGRCADRAVQIFGGRGYLRTNAAERLWRELRVDRIWEGTSEIQRLIVARALERRGVERVLH